MTKLSINNNINNINKTNNNGSPNKKNIYMWVCNSLGYLGYDVSEFIKENLNNGFK